MPLGEIGSCLTLQSEKVQAILKADAEVRRAKRSFQVTERALTMKENSMIKKLLRGITREVT